MVEPEFVGWVAELVHRHRARLLGYVRRRGLGAEDALDVVQDTFATFLELPQARTAARGGDDAIRLLTVIARHHMLNRRRRPEATREVGEIGWRADQVLPAVDGESTEQLLLRAEELARVYGCLMRMNRVQRAAILLSVLDERPGEDVSALLGVTPGHVRVLLHRAREYVRGCPLSEMPALSAREVRASVAA